jgi:hypothetical protein
MTLNLINLCLPTEFVIKKGLKQWEAKIYSGEVEIAEIKKGEGLSLKLIRLKDKMEWVLTNQVHGERRPFSFSVYKARPYADSDALGDEVFVIRDQLFKHNSKFYMIASHPEEKSWNEYDNSSIKYICRLDDFPYSELSQVDFHHYSLRDKIKRLRGNAVGEASGLGMEERGHHVRLDSELEDIGLFIAAFSYLLYASG